MGKIARKLVGVQLVEVERQRQVRVESRKKTFVNI